MVEKRIIQREGNDLFNLAISNSRTFYYRKGRAGDFESDPIGTRHWDELLQEHTITRTIVPPAYYYEDEQLLGMFILKWS